MYFVYAIYNKCNNKIYTGQTVDLNKRLRLHNKKEFRNSYTAMFDGEWQVIYKEIYSTRTEALMRERQLKSYQGRQFLKQFIPL